MKKIVVTRLQNLGDTVMATPILHGIKKMHPEAELIFITRPEGYTPVSRLPFVDKILVFPDKKTMAAQWAAFKAFKGADLAFLIDTTHRISVLSCLAGAKERVGVKMRRGMYLTKGVDWDKDMDFRFDPINYATILKKTTGMDIMQDPQWDKYYFSEATDEEKQHVEALAKERKLDMDKPYIVFSMYTGIRAKNWPESKWKELWAMLAKKYQLPAVMTGANPQKLDLGPNVIDFTGVTNQYEFGYLVKKAALVMSGCSAPIHIARAFGVPMICLYGPTPKGIAAPPEIVAAIESKAECSPCNGYCSGPCAKPFCMDMITVEEVFAAVDKFLQKQGIK
jgi:ADP-heptose:LPS heptosyltransferase